MLSKSASLVSTRSKINTTDKYAAFFSSFRFTSCFIQLLDQYYQYLFMCKLKIVLFFCYSMLFISLFTMHVYSNLTMIVVEFTSHAILNIFQKLRDLLQMVCFHLRCKKSGSNIFGQIYRNKDEKPDGKHLESDKCRWLQKNVNNAKNFSKVGKIKPVYLRMNPFVLR